MQKKYLIYRYHLIFLLPDNRIIVSDSSDDETINLFSVDKTDFLDVNNVIATHFPEIELELATKPNILNISVTKEKLDINLLLNLEESNKPNYLDSKKNYYKNQDVFRDNREAEIINMVFLVKIKHIGLESSEMQHLVIEYKDYESINPSLSEIFPV